MRTPPTGELRSLVAIVLARGPRSIEDFRMLAADEGMLLPE
jgi:hypothetical protein